MDELAFRPAVDVAAQVRAGELTAEEAVEAAVRRAESAAALNAFVELDGDRALAAARAAAHGPLAGVPVVVKANTAVAGWNVDHGSRLLAGHRPPESAFLVRRLEEAGAVVIGITRMPEFAALPTTEPRHGGAVANPWDPGRTPGGSSGGSAAVAAAGVVPIAHGTDGGGSLRIPAACCGLVGLKPTRGRISRGPELGDSFLAVDGVLTRTVADTAAALDVLAGYEVGDATWVPRDAEPFLHTVERRSGPLRIAVSAANLLGAPVDGAHVDAVRETAEALAALGHHVEEVDPVLPGPEVLGLFITAFATARAAELAAAARAAGRDPAEGDVEPLSLALYELARSTSAVDYAGTIAELQRHSRRMVAFFADWDVLLTPALAERPLPTGECHGAMAEPMQALGRAAQFAPYTALFNVTGQPAISVPAGLAADGLPTAVQLAGRPLAEATLLQLARELELTRPWAGPRPALAARPPAAAA